MRRHLCVGIILLLAASSAELRECLLRTASAQQASSPQAEPAMLPEASRNTTAPERPASDGHAPSVRLRPPLVERLAADPFQYRTPEGTGPAAGSFTPAPSLELPPGIKVAGILVMDSGDAVAAMRFPGEDDLYYVREDDHLLVRSVQRDARVGRAADAAGARPALYLKISKITPEHVVVYPEHSPENIHIFR